MPEKQALMWLWVPRSQKSPQTGVWKVRVFRGLLRGNPGIGSLLIQKQNSKSKSHMRWPAHSMGLGPEPVQKYPRPLRQFLNLNTTGISGWVIL